MKYIILACLFVSLNLHAGIDSASGVVARQVAKKLKIVQEAFSSREFSGVPFLHKNKVDETAYYLKRIRLQYATFAAFDISLFEVKIKPFIEFRWTRKNPSGWVNYKRSI